MKIAALSVAALALGLVAAASPPPPVSQPQAPASAAAGQNPAQVLLAEFQAYQNSVYVPYCEAHKGTTAVALIGSPDRNGFRPAWPAVINCKDGHVLIVKTPVKPPTDNT